MESGHSTTKLTYADYVRFPDDGLRHEIIDGEHYVTPAPSVRHQRISGKLFHLIQSYLEANPRGELFFMRLSTPCWGSSTSWCRTCSTSPRSGHVM